MYFILISTALIVLLTIGSGVYLLYNNTDSSKTKLKKALRTNLFAIIPCLVTVSYTHLTLPTKA